MFGGFGCWGLGGLGFGGFGVEGFMDEGLGIQGLVFRGALDPRSLEKSHTIKLKIINGAHRFLGIRESIFWGFA